MKKISRIKRVASAESIAQLAEKGGDVSPYFTNKGKMMAPHASLGIELNQELIEELNEVAAKLSVSRPDLIKLLIRQGLDQHYLAQKARKAG